VVLKVILVIIGVIFSIFLLAFLYGVFFVKSEPKSASKKNLNLLKRKLEQIKWSENSTFESDIDRGIEMSFNWFKKKNPIIQKGREGYDMYLWENFIAYCYCVVNADGGGVYSDAQDFLKHNPDIFDFELNELMKNGVDECISWGEKYFIEHVESLLNKYDEDEANEQVELDMKNISSSIKPEIFKLLLNN